MTKTIEHYVKAFSRLNVNRSHGRTSPHKPVMLLAVIELAENGLITENRILYSPQLLERFRAYFEVVQQPGDACKPYFPFFHLKSDRFWHLLPMPGREDIVNSLRTVRSPTDITDNIAYARLNDDLFALLQSRHGRSILRQTLIDTWFSQSGEVIKTVTAEQRQINRYELSLQNQVEHKTAQEPVKYAKKVRDAAFSRIVREAYDYRCAASGWRVILPDGTVLVEAAYLIPYAETQDDDPRNGIALAPNYHWALDHNILAPGPDLKWHVSPILDRRNRDYQELIEIDNHPIMLPRDRKYYPRMDALKWRIKRLVK